MKPVITIVMTAYNSEQFISEAIDSVLQQSFTGWELIIADDCSTDSTITIAERYAKQDSRIKIIRLPQNTGSPIIPRNTAISMAEGLYVFPLDSDDKITPDCLSRMLAAIEMGLGDVIYSEVEFFGDKTGKLDVPLPTYANMHKFNCVVNSALYRKSDFNKYGGYDINMQDGYKDWGFWLNFIEDGKSFYRIPDVLFYYRMKDNTRNKIDSYKQKLLYKYVAKKYNKKICYVKIPWYNKIRLLFIHLLRSRNTYARYKERFQNPAYPVISNPKLIMTLLIKNEQGIIRENLEFHKSMGVDGFIVTDNHSTDNTRKILEEYKERGWILEIIDEPAQDYSQADWVHRMAALAKNKYNADWIINADADEFWRSKSGNLKKELSVSSANMLHVPIFNMLDQNGKWPDNVNKIILPLSDEDSKKLIKENKLCLFNQFSRQIPKVLVRASDYVHIHMGNHNADMVYKHKPIYSKDIIIYHFNSRGFKQFKNKMITGGAAFERNEKLGKDMGAHWRYFYNGFKTGTLDIKSEYEKSIGIKCKEKIQHLLEKDTFVQDFCKLMEIENRFPKIMSFNTMLERLLSGASMARFGDAEFDIAMQRNKEDPYQKPSDELSKRLLEILKTPSNDKLLICIPPFDSLHNNIQNFKDGLSFWRWYWRERWDTLSPLFVNAEYGNSFFSRDSVFYELDLELIKKIWDNRDVVFVVPDNGRFEYDERIFGNIKSQAKITVPATNAFDEYDNILKQCLKYKKNTLFFIAAGPTATVLAKDLSSAGYQALDMGHFTNCYRQYLGEAKQPEAYPMKRL
ncbi:MAG: DUF1792 domain-containing protein [Alphaproteobacteria bacterium]|nr:DUF1792 domain-containing protein [Alphaproteobacteria bacterium]